MINVTSFPASVTDLRSHHLTFVGRWSAKTNHYMINKLKGTNISKLLKAKPDNSLNSIKNAFLNAGKVPYKWNAVNQSLPYTLSVLPL